MKNATRNKRIFSANAKTSRLGLAIVCAALGALMVATVARDAAERAGGTPPETPPETRALPKTALLQKAPRAVLAHVMVSFGTPVGSGGWRGWNYANNIVHHDPEKLLANGQRDIASVYYPAIGPYDMADPDTAEYHCQLARMAGIDGFVFDLGFYNEPADGKPSAQRKCMESYVPMMAAYGIKGVLVYEDKAHWVWDQNSKTREDARKAAYEDLNSWLRLLQPVQYRVGDRPLVFFFSYEHSDPVKGVSRLSPDELQTWTGSFPEAQRPITLAQWLKSEYYGVLDGRYDWVLMEKAPPDKKPFVEYADLDTVKRFRMQAHKDASWLLEGKRSDFYIPCAFPGFDDRGSWGWGGGPRQIVRDDGSVYRYTWEEAIKDQVPVVQIATWNDWFEGTIVEPSTQFGTQYLEITRENAARFKNQPPLKGDLRLPEWIYRLRKSDHSAHTQQAVRRACERIRKGDFEGAQALVVPLVK